MRQLNFIKKSGVDINEFGSTLEDVQTFANHLGIQINIVDSDYFKEIIFSTEPKDQMIYLYKNKNHFDVITSMPAFLCKDYCCHTCKTSYAKRDKHKCPSKCIACFKSFPDENMCSISNKKLIDCNDCNRTFYGKDCFDEHKRNRSSGEKTDIVCNIVKKCLK